MLLTDRNFNTSFFDPAEEVIRFYFSTFFGFLVIQKFIFLFYQDLVLLVISLAHLRENQFSVILGWFMLC